MKVLGCKRIGSIVPANQAAEDAFRKISHGTILEMELTKKRNGQHHKLYWALITKVWESQNVYPTPENLHTALKFAVGHVDVSAKLDGTPILVPRPTTYEKMDQLEFSDYFDRICDVLAVRFLPGVTGARLKAEVSEMIGASISDSPAVRRTMAG
jgi:hypothetical protein